MATSHRIPGRYDGRTREGKAAKRGYDDGFAGRQGDKIASELGDRLGKIYAAAWGRGYNDAHPINE